ncbi:MAG: HAMP domain-containing histidine kinase [Bacteroidetes bacterium]|nr:HAMP domain-containing histidine kinase [Bacteroidota bacterium]
MNRKLIVFIIVSMTVALLGMLGIQLYLVGEAVKVKEATFVRDVNQVMQQVVMRLEKEELKRQYEHHMSVMSRRSGIMSAYDSISKSMMEELQRPMTAEEYSNFMRRVLIAQEMLQDMMLGYSEEKGGRSAEPVRIDSLVKAELRRSGIDTEYELGIYSPTRNALLFQKTGRYPQKLLEEAFAFDMYPTITPSQYADKLLIFFPHEKRFIIGQLSDLFVLSGIFVVIIILAFAATIFTIFRQKQLSEMKNDFVNNMTHEFKTPISTIALACEALRDNDIQKSEALYNVYINMIDEENKRLGAMAEQVLQSAVMEKGELTLRKDRVDLHEVLRQAVASKQLMAKSRNGHIFMELKADNAEVLGDRVHLTNVMLNLLDNALKYTEEAPQVVVRSRNIPNAVEISVQDNGIGISKSNQKRIFEKLYRVPTGNVHNVKGFGLGLSYVKAVAEKLGGMVGVNSELKRGSTFYIRLPLFHS